MLRVGDEFDVIRAVLAVRWCNFPSRPGDIPPFGLHISLANANKYKEGGAVRMDASVPVCVCVSVVVLPNGGGASEPSTPKQKRSRLTWPIQYIHGESPSRPRVCRRLLADLTGRPHVLRCGDLKTKSSCFSCVSGEGGQLEMLYRLSATSAVGSIECGTFRNNSCIHPWLG